MSVTLDVQIESEIYFGQSNFNFFALLLFDVKTQNSEQRSEIYF